MVGARASGGLQVQNRDGISRSVSRSVAQPGRAPRSGRGGRRFKSCHSDHYLADPETAFPTVFSTETMFPYLAL